jgi:AcrR family transcriptional regulator
MGKRLESLPAKQSKRKLASAERRRQLVSIAMDLIAAKGFEGLRFQEVAKEAGINNATLAYHFANKEELIMGVLQQLGAEVRRTPGRPADRLPTALEELRLEFESMADLLQKRPKLFVVLAELSLRAMRDPVMESVVKTLDGFWRQHIEEVLAQGVKEGSFRSNIDVDGTANALMAQIKGIGLHATTGRLKPAEIERSVAEIARQTEHWLTHGR